MEGITKKHKETFGSDQYVHCLDYDGGFTDAYVYQNLIIYTLDMHNLLCVSYSSIKLLKIQSYHY